MRTSPWCVAGLLSLGYGAKYFSMAPAFVLRTVIRQTANISAEHWDNTIGSGYVVYAASKLWMGPVVDRLGGRTIFLVCLYSLALITALQSMVAGRWAFTACNLSMTMFGAPVWISLTKIASAWAPDGRSGTMMGAISLSYLVDDVAVRWYVANALQVGWKWNWVMLSCAAVAAALATPALLCIKPTPESPGMWDAGRSVCIHVCTACGERGASAGGTYVVVPVEPGDTVPETAVPEAAAETACVSLSPPLEDGVSAAGVSEDDAPRTGFSLNQTASCGEMVASLEVDGQPVPADGMGPQTMTRCQLLSQKRFSATVLLYALLYMSREYLSNYSVPYLAVVWCSHSRFASSNAGSTPAAASVLEDCVSGNDAAAKAAMGSVVFSVVGAFSTIFCGFFKDRLSIRATVCLSLFLIAVSCTAIFTADTHTRLLAPAQRRRTRIR